MEPDESPPANMGIGGDIRSCGTGVATEKKAEEGGAGAGNANAVTPRFQRSPTQRKELDEFTKQSSKPSLIQVAQAGKQEFTVTKTPPEKTPDQKPPQPQPSLDMLRPMLFVTALLRCALALDLRGFLFLGCLGVWTNILEGSLLFVGFAALACPSIIPDLAVLSLRTPSLEQQAHVLDHLRRWNVLQFERTKGSAGAGEQIEGKETHPAPDLEKKPHPGENAVCEEEKGESTSDKKNA